MNQNAMDSRSTPRRSGLAIAAVLALLGATLAIGAEASTFVALTPEEMVAQAGAVVVGRVLDVRSFWNEENTVIVTEAAFEVDEVLLGTVPAVVTVRTFGGQVGRYKIVAAGFPELPPRERMLLFLSPEKDGSMRVLGYQQGQYRIVGQSPRELAVPMTDWDMTLVHKDGRRAALQRALPLDTLKTNLRVAAQRLGRK